MKFLLPLISQRNLEFQSGKPKVQRLYSKTQSLFETITGFYSDDEFVEQHDSQFIPYFENLRDADDNARCSVPLLQVELGPFVTAELACINEQSSTSNRINDFWKKCRTFYIILDDQIYRRFEFANKSTKMMEKLAFVDNAKKLKNITECALQFGLDIHQVDLEYKLLRKSYHVGDYTGDIRNGVEELFWKNASHDDNFPFTNKFSKCVAISPHSSAAVERIFGSINPNKTKMRNRLSPATITGILPICIRKDRLLVIIF